MFTSRLAGLEQALFLVLLAGLLIAWSISQDVVALYQIATQHLPHSSALFIPLFKLSCPLVRFRLHNYEDVPWCIILIHEGLHQLDLVVGGKLGPIKYGLQ